uniref:(California timema) hypothetical protein n=1 Tax=Timema californicum TaxID=61474 RepID=A0A7R9J5S8_TIMCA|nr:unnamed protein product [Timema californicum]
MGRFKNLVDFGLQQQQPPPLQPTLPHLSWKNKKADALPISSGKTMEKFENVLQQQQQDPTRQRGQRNPGKSSAPAMLCITRCLLLRGSVFTFGSSRCGRRLAALTAYQECPPTTFLFGRVLTTTASRRQLPLRQAVI